MSVVNGFGEVATTAGAAGVVVGGTAWGLTALTSVVFPPALVPLAIAAPTITGYSALSAGAGMVLKQA